MKLPFIVLMFLFMMPSFAQLLNSHPDSFVDTVRAEAETQKGLDVAEKEKAQAARLRAEADARRRRIDAAREEKLSKMKEK